MISFKEQRKREKNRKEVKRTNRIVKAEFKNPNVILPPVLPGNKDSGIPYHGKDKFSGQIRKMKDRLVKDCDSEFRQDRPENVGVKVTRLYYADNNKYNGDGTLKD